MIFGKIFPFLKTGDIGANILLTGIPRSGTTLACRLLCDFSQTIALNEPMDRSLFQNPNSAKENISTQFKVFRKSLLKNGTALARTREGKITDNAFDPESPNRERVVERSTISFDKQLDDDFTLIMKHCAEFSLLLPEIAKSYNTFALIRNPLAVLSSWASVDVPVSRGKVAKSAQLNPSFHEALNNQGDDLLKRQLFILSWYFGQFKDFENENIIRYEEMISNPESTLKPLSTGVFDSTSSNLTNKNTSKNYNKPQLKIMGDALLNSEGNYWNFYSKEEVLQVMHKIEFDA